MKKLPVVFLACKLFEGVADHTDGVSAQFLDYGLHAVPKQLKQVVQERVD